ncbi:MAG: hypothetical protein ACXVEE_09865 [Polyangiales bacterium]
MRTSPLFALFAVSVLSTFAAPADATCMGGCGAAPIDSELPFWPSTKPLVVRGTCQWTCSAPGGPGSGGSMGAKELALTDVIGKGKPVHAFAQGQSKDEYVFKGAIASGKVYSVHFENGPGTPTELVVADAAIDGQFTATPSVVHEDRTFVARGAKITVSGSAHLTLEKGSIDADQGAELVLESGGVRVITGGVRAHDVTVLDPTGKTKVEGTARIVVDANATRISSWTGKSLHDGATIDAGKGARVAKGKKTSIVALPLPPKMPERDLLLIREAFVPLSKILPEGHVHTRLLAAGSTSWLDVVMPESASGGQVAVKPTVLSMVATSLDDAGLESVETVPHTLQIARIEMLDRPGKARSVFYPEVGRCALDDAPLAENEGHELPMIPGRAHVLRCTRVPASPVATLEIAATEAGPVRFNVQIEKGPNAQSRKIFVRLEDNGGRSLHGPILGITGPAGVSVAPIEEVAIPNSYSVWRTTVTWTTSSLPVLTFAVPGTTHAIPMK